MNNRLLYILIGVLLFATVSAFIVNVRGDIQQVATPSINVDVSSPDIGFFDADLIDVFPATVPRFCDVQVTTDPYTIVRVYRNNNVDTGISCTTDSEGVCVFEFGSEQPRGTYKVRAGGLETTVYLEPSAVCESDVDAVQLTPQSLEAIAGMPYVFEFNAYDSEGNLIPSTPNFSVDDEGIGSISNISGLPSNKAVFIGTKTGATNVHAEFGRKEAVSTVNVVPGRCNDIQITSHLSDSYVVNSNVGITAQTYDTYGNEKGDVYVTLEYTDPSGHTTYLTNTSDDNGQVSFRLYLGTQSGTAQVKLMPGEGIFCPQRYDSVSITLLPSNPVRVEVQPEDISADVGQTIDYTAHAYDEYDNEVIDVDMEWLSSDESVAVINSDGRATAMFPGDAQIIANATYQILVYELHCDSFVCYYVPVNKVVGVEGIAQLHVNNGDAEHIQIDPVSVDVKAGETQLFTAVVYDEFGAVVDDAAVDWDTNVGTVDSNGLFTAQQYVGSGTVNASYGALEASAHVNVVPNDPAKIKLSLLDPLVPVDSTAQVIANVTDTYNNVISGINVDYEVLAGNVTIQSTTPTDNNGISTAVFATGNAESNVILKATVSGTSVSDTITFNVVVPNSTIVGTVVDWNAIPIEGALVEIEGTQYSNLTNSDGMYVINNVDLVGTYNITASKQGYQSQMFQVDLDKNHMYTFDFVLIQYATITGTVRDSASLPIQDANVSVIKNNAEVASVQTAADGTYSLQIAPTFDYSYTVQAQAPGYEAASIDTVIHPGDSFVFNFMLGDEDSSPPVINFVDPTPVSDSYVQGIITVSTLAYDAHYDSTNISVGQDTLAVCATPDCSVDFDTGVIGDGDITILATAKDTFGQESQVSRVLHVDNTAPDVQFVDPTPADGSQQMSAFTVNVSAFDDTGVNRVVISVNGVDEVECQDSVCEYVIDPAVYSGAVTVVATAYSELQSKSIQRTFDVVGSGHTLTTLEVYAIPSIISTADSSLIRVVALDENGDAMQGINVDFTAGGGSITPASGTTNANGIAEAQFSSTDAGTFDITVTAGSLVNVTTVRVVLPSELGTLTGTVTNSSGDPLQGAVVEVYKNNQLLFTTVANATGGYSFDLPADTYDVVVSHAGYLTARDAGIVINPASVTVKDYVLTKMSRLYGVVANESGDPVEGATLRAYRNGVLVSTVQSQADGSYEFELASGVYVVEITHPDYLTSWYTTYLASAAELEKNVVLYK